MKSPISTLKNKYAQADTDHRQYTATQIYTGKHRHTDRHRHNADFRYTNTPYTN